MGSWICLHHMYFVCDIFLAFSVFTAMREQDVRASSIWAMDGEYGTVAWITNTLHLNALENNIQSTWGEHIQLPIHICLEFWKYHIQSTCELSISNYPYTSASNSEKLHTKHMWCKHIRLPTIQSPSNTDKIYYYKVCVEIISTFKIIIVWKIFTNIF